MVIYKEGKHRNNTLPTLNQIRTTSKYTYQVKGNGIAIHTMIILDKTRNKLKKRCTTKRLTIQI